jgi:hypothetical protein
MSSGLNPISHGIPQKSRPPWVETVVEDAKSNVVGNLEMQTPKPKKNKLF